MNKVDILCVGAHPDDVEFGCGGTIIKAKKLGLKVGIIILTKENEVREKEAKKAADFLEIDEFLHFDYIDGYLKNDALEKLTDCIAQLMPDYIFCPLNNDYHPDHNMVYQLVKDASFLSGRKKYQNNYVHKNIYFFNLNKNNIIKPNILFDISDVIEKKQELCAIHVSQKDVLNNFVLFAGQIYGVFAKTKYAEGFIVEESLVLNIENIFVRK